MGIREDKIMNEIKELELRINARIKANKASDYDSPEMAASKTNKIAAYECILIDIKQIWKK